MKKILIHTAIWSSMCLILASCNKENGVDESGRLPIELATETKAPSTEENTGTQIAQGQEVGLFIAEDGGTSTTYEPNLKYKANGNGGLAGVTPQLYPENGNGVTISAYHPYNENAADWYYFVVKADQSADADYHASDLMHAAEKQYAKRSGAHTLTFEHKLSRVTCQLVSGVGSPIILGAEITLLNVNTTANFNRLTGEVIPNLATRSNILMNNKLGAVIAPGQRIHTDDQVLKIKLIDGKEHIYRFTGANLDIEPGKSLDITVTVNKSSIEATYTVEDWIRLEGDGGVWMDIEKNQSLGQLPNCYLMKALQPYGDMNWIEIPVLKAYMMWEKDPSLRDQMERSGENLDGEVEAELLWQDNPEIKINTQITGTGTGRYASINIIVWKNRMTNNTEGNAVVAVKIGGKIRWSYHIWITHSYEMIKYDEGVKFSNGERSYDFMSMFNLGAIDEPGSPKAMGLHYQWGRKDPFTGAADWDWDGDGEPDEYTKLYKTDQDAGTIDEIVDIEDGIFQKTMSQSRDIVAHSVMNPHYFFPNVQFPTYNDNQWGENGVKSPFDPCPYGWKVPPYKNGKSPLHGLVNPNSEQYPVANWNHGWWNLLSMGQAFFFSETGSRGNDGKITMGTASYWTANRGVQMELSNTEFNTNKTATPGVANAVRCVKDHLAESNITH